MTTSTWRSRSIGQVLGGGERGARQGQALDRRVVGQVDEHDHVAQHAGGGEFVAEELGVGVGDAHGGEDDGEAAVLVLAAWPGARSGRRAGCGAGPEPEKIGSFWPRTRRVEPVDGGDAGLDELARIGAGRRVDGGAVHRARRRLDRIGGRPSRGSPRPLNSRPSSLRREGDLHRLVEEAHPGALQVQVFGALEDQDQDLAVGDADHLAVADGAPRGPAIRTRSPKATPGRPSSPAGRRGPPRRSGILLCSCSLPVLRRRRTRRSHLPLRERGWAVRGTRLLMP